MRPMKLNGFSNTIQYNTIHIKSGFHLIVLVKKKPIFLASVRERQAVHFNLAEKQPEKKQQTVFVAKIWGFVSK